MTKCTGRRRDYLEVFKSKDGWRWRLRAGNHEVISIGEAYGRRHDAVRGAKRAHPRVRVVEG